MHIKSISLEKLKLNESNPRYILDDDFDKLLNSILLFPKMLSVRPLVINTDFSILGGNMRYKVLMHIAKSMNLADVRERLNKIEKYKEGSTVKKEAIVEYWQVWKDKPIIPVIEANELTDEEKREFIIKDNIAYGKWDFDLLSTFFDMEELDEWGVDMSFMKVEDEPQEQKEEKKEEAKIICCPHCSQQFELENKHYVMSEDKID